MNHRDHFIQGEWRVGQGEELVSWCPATADRVWSGTCATADEVDEAVRAARGALADWSRRPLEERIGYAKAFAEEIKRREDMFSRLISREMGKPLWESRTEVAAVIGKVGLTIQAIEERRNRVSLEMEGGHAVTWYRPLGVVGVLGPFNLPAHLPNGHLVPALLAGNTAVFKPSEQTPAVGELMVDAWHSVKLPSGVLNLVQGGVESAKSLAYHSELGGLLFTGSYAVGLELSRWYGNHPEKLLALELGGNNPLVVHEVNHLEAAVMATLQSAYVTSGQRCTCARRLIVVEGEWAQQFLQRLETAIANVQVGPFEQEPEPYMGPVVSSDAAEKLMQAQDRLLSRGATSRVRMQRDQTRLAQLTPGLIDVTEVSPAVDEEWFGPLLQVIRVPDFEHAIAAANATGYGLAAGLLSDSRERFEQFRFEVQAGIVNWNRQTTGASGRLPFGGIGHSGNHRPSGYFAIDYCSDPVASLEYPQCVLPDSIPPGL
jgi:succinylglutamic semialdehyde dehydrogenase